MGLIKQLLAGLAAAFGSFCLGASIGWGAPLQSKIQNGGYGFSVSEYDFSWAASLLTLGAAFVCIPVGFLISAFGRKWVMIGLVFPYLLGWLLVCFAQNLIMLFIGRFILGMCGGAFCITAPMYTTEVAEVRIRGAMGSFFQLLIVHGVLYGFVMGAYLDLTPANISMAVLPIFFFIFFIFMPESPVWLAMKGKSQQAEKSLKFFRGKNYDASGDIAAAAEKNKQEKPNVLALLKRKVTLKGLGISIALMIFQQFTGINAIIFYSTSLFESVGTGLSAENSTIVVGLVMVLATFVSIALVDRLGRVILLAVSALIMAISVFLVGLYFFLKESDENYVKDIGWLPVLSVCIFIVFFSFGFGPVPWVIMAELFSEDIKGVAGSISGTTNWIAAFIVTKVFPILKNELGPAWALWVFTIVGLIAFIFVIFLVPETKNKTLDEIQGILGG